MTEGQYTQQDGRRLFEEDKARALSELHYSMLIQWSDEDQAYLVRLPDWERAGRVLGQVTHGDSYAEALEHGLEALEALIASAHKHHETLPEPQTFVAA